VLNTNNITIKLGLEVGGTIYPVLSRTGQQTVTLPPGALAWFDIDLEMPAGQQFWLRPYVASGSGSEYVLSNGNTTSNTASEGFVSGDSAYSGTIAQSESGVARPLAILGETASPKPSMVFFGDSIGRAQGDNLKAENRGGFLIRRLGKPCRGSICASLRTQQSRSI
jgi:hypothetical protein